MTTFRTTGPWGAGKGSNLTAAEVDNNFYDISVQIDDLETSRPQPDEFANVAIAGTRITFTLESGTVLGPVDLPVLKWRWRGEWVAFTGYAPLDVFKVTGSGFYLSLLDHTSAATFDPAAVNGSSEPLYHLLFSDVAIDELPLATLPAAPLSLIEIAETDGGSPPIYTAKHIRISDLELTLGSTDIALGSTTTTIAGLALTGLTTAAIRDASGAFDVTLAANSAPALTAGRTLTIDMSNVAHTLDLGATANTIAFPSASDYTLAALSVAGTWSALQQFNDGAFALKGLTSGTVTVKAAAVAGTNTLTLPAGTTDFSATGGASQVLKQVSVGAAFTVGQLANTDITGLGTMSTQSAGAVAITGGSIVGLTGLAIRDTSAAFDVTIAATSAVTLTAGRILTLNMRNVAHTLDLGATAGTIWFPNAAAPTLAAHNVAGTWSATQTSMTISGATLTGATTLPDSGQISSAGELLLGSTSASARLRIGGTYTSANTILVDITGAFASSGTGTQIANRIATTFAPSGASLSQLIAYHASPTLNSTAFTLASFRPFVSHFTLGASFSGIVTIADMFSAEQPTVSGGLITTLNGFRSLAQTNGDGITAGSATNRGLRVDASTAAAGAGGTVTNEAVSIALGSGSSAGTTIYGARITGNGGAASTNWAIHSASQALSQLLDLRIGTGTAIATTATREFLAISVMAGIPTGVPRDAAAGAAQITYDSTNKKLMVYDQITATWKGVVVA